MFWSLTSCLRPPQLLRSSDLTAAKLRENVLDEVYRTISLAAAGYETASKASPAYAGLAEHAQFLCKLASQEVFRISNHDTQHVSHTSCHYEQHPNEWKTLHTVSPTGAGSSVHDIAWETNELCSEPSNAFTAGRIREDLRTTGAQQALHATTDLVSGGSPLLYWRQLGVDAGMSGATVSGAHPGATIYDGGRNASSQVYTDGAYWQGISQW